MKVKPKEDKTNEIFRVSYNSDFIYTSLDMIKQYIHLLDIPFKLV